MNVLQKDKIRNVKTRTIVLSVIGSALLVGCAVVATFYFSGINVFGTGTAINVIPGSASITLAQDSASVEVPLVPPAQPIITPPAASPEQPAVIPMDGGDGQDEGGDNKYVPSYAGDFEYGKTLNEGEKLVALTFDDGPHKTNTNEIIDVLEQYGAHATFFMVGNRVSAHADVVKRIFDTGNELANHTWSHSHLNNLSEDELKQEIENTNDAVEAITGMRTRLIRPPYGEANETVKSLSGYPLIYWSVDTEDWRTKDTLSTINEALSSAHNGSIILMHDIQNSTPAAVREIVPKLIEQGYRLVTVSELLSYSQSPITPGSSHRQVKF